jgi:2-polyprenyl-3-methyl-5-hydroxy-6-metoxy-1,4-benzoquinol methylase
MPPGISAESKSRAVLHYEAQADGYDRHVNWGPLRFLRRRERSAVLQLARLEDPAVRTVIDVGCGGGFYSRAAKRAGKWVHALDIAPGMIERLRAEVDEATVADLESLSLPRRYDVVLCCGVLDFVTRPEAAFERLCALCAPGGRLVVLVPRAGPGSFPYRFEKRLAGLRVNSYRRAWLAERAARHGLALAAAVHPLPTNQALLFRPAR